MPQELDPTWLDAAAATAGQRTSASLAAAATIDPNREARHRQIARRTGLPIETVRNAPTEAQVRAIREQYSTPELQEALRASPNATRWLSRGDNAAVAHDDAGLLARFGSFLLLGPAALPALATAGADALRSGVTSSGYTRGLSSDLRSPSFYTGFLKSSGAGAASGIAGAVEAPAEIVSEYAPLTPTGRMLGAAAGGLLDRARNRRRAWAEVQQAVRPQTRSPMGRDIGAAIESIGVSFAAAGVTLATGNPWAGAAVLGVPVFGQSYGEARDEGLTIAGAALKSGIDAAIEIGTERIPEAAILRGFHGASPLSRALLDVLGAEVLTEQFATLGQDFNQWAMIDANKGKTFDDYVAEIGPHALSTLVATVTTTGLLTAPGAVYRGIDRLTGRQAVREARAAEAQQVAQHLTDMANLAAASKLRERDPTSFHEFVQQAAEDGPVEAVYVSVDQLGDVLNQSGLEPAQVEALQASLAPVVAEAAQHGTDVRIPVEDFATHLAGTPAGDALIEHLKSDPTGMSLAEAKEFMANRGEELQAEVEQAIAEAQGDETFRVSAERVETAIADMLHTANRFTREVNEANASGMAAFYSTMAARMGVTPEELFARFPIRVQAEGVGELAQDDQNTPGSLDDVKALAATRGVELDLTETTDGIGLEWLARKNKTRGKAAARGAGHDVLSALIRYADATGKRVELSVYRGDPKLVKYYEDHGFAVTANDDPLAPVMVREPQAANDNSGAPGEYDQQNRGAYSPATDAITLLKTADLSTFLHESGHFYLEMFDRLAADPNSPQDVRDDLDTIVKWFGVKDAATWRSYSLEQKRPHHEKWARGFEAYLFTGKPPSLRLQPLFQRFRAWLIAVYRKATALDVTVTPAIRGVMDRMLATADEIAIAEQSRSMMPLFADQASSGLDENGWREYQRQAESASQEAIGDLEARSLRDMQWIANARSREINRLKRQTRAIRNAVTQQVTREVMAEPVYRAMDFLKRGQLDGQKVEQPVKLSIEEVDALYPDEATRSEIKGKLGYGAYGMLGSENAIHPEQAAELFGFTSGDHLIRSLVSAEPVKARVAGLVEQRLLEEHGDLTDDKAIEEAANRAVHSDARARVVATELAALNQLTGKPKTLNNAARAYAKEMIARIRVRNLKPSLYESAAARAGKAAMQNLASGKRTEAAAEKRNQLINVYAAKAAMQAKDEVEQALEYFGRLLRPGAAKSIDRDYLDQIETLLERVDLRRGQSLRAIDKRTSLAEWIEKQRELGLDPLVPPDLLDQLGRRSYKDMTIEELRGLRDAIKNIEHLGRLKNKLLTAKRDRDFSNAVGLLTDGITQFAYKDKPGTIAKAKGLTAVAENIGAFVIAHRKLAEVAREMDGEHDGGAVWEYFIRPMNEAADREVAMLADASRRFAEITAGLKLSSKLEYVPEIGQSLSEEHRFAIALNTGNTINRERVMAGYNWGEDQLNAAVATLTAEQWQTVQRLWDFIGSYWPEIAAKETRVTGVTPERVDADPIRVRTADGQELELPGGYYPIKYDRDQSSQADAHAEAEEWRQALNGAYTAATTRRGHTKARVESTGWPLRYDLGVVTEHVAQVIHDLTHHEMLIDTTRLLRSPSVDKAMRYHYGPEVVRLFRETMKATAAGNLPAKDAAERWARALRNNVTIAGMGWNLFSAMQQPLGLTMGVQRVGAKWIALGAQHWMANPHSAESTTKWIVEQSPFMANRGLTRLQELNDLRGRITGQKGAMSAVTDSYFYLLEKAQLLADVPTWLGQYAKSTATGEEHARAVALADQAVLDSQGGGQMKDLAAVQRNPVLAMFTNFMSYQLTLFNRLYNSGVQFHRVGAEHLPRFIVDCLLASVIPTTMSVVLRAALHGEPPDEEDLVLQNALGIFGSFVLVRDVAGLVQTRGFRDAPVGSFLPAVAPLAKQAWRGEDFEVDGEFIRAANKAGGVLFGYPAGQIDKTLRGLEAMREGRTSNPAAAVIGPPPKRAND